MFNRLIKQATLMHCPSPIARFRFAEAAPASAERRERRSSVSQAAIGASRMPPKLRSANSTSSHLLALALAAFALLAGCASAPPKAPTQPKAVFYPAAPDPPRIQHLAKFAGARDLEKGPSGLATFLIGDEHDGEELVRPYGVAMFDGKIYVADSRAPGLAVFDLVAKKFSIVSGSGSGKMQRPTNVTIDTDGTKYITDLGRNQVLVYDRADSFVTAFGAKDEFKPVDTAIAGERLYVVDIEHFEVWVLNKRSGKLLFKFGTPGSAEGGLHQPTNLAIGPDGDVYIVETGNFRVSRFTPEGKYVRSIGEAGQAAGQFARPKGIAIDRSGRLFVGDAAFQNVQIIDASGRPLMAFGQPADGSQGLNLPAGVSIDYDNLALFRGYADPAFTLEHVILVVSQFGPNQVDVFGFGKKRDAEYPPETAFEIKPEPKTPR
jgi:DNA-binding beta-propeller fold protein YncE